MGRGRVLAGAGRAGGQVFWGGGVGWAWWRGGDIEVRWYDRDIDRSDEDSSE